MKNIKNNQKGQTLVILLVYMIIAIIVTTASIALVINSSQGTDKVYQGTNAYDVAESGIENAMLRLLRNPSYSGETLTVGGGQAVVTITGSNPKTIISIGTVSNFTRTIQVVISTTNNVLSVTSWNEI